MIRLTETANTTLSPEQAFEHVGDFSNIEKWDPGVVASAKRADGPTDVGTVYDLDLSYGGRRMEMDYTVTDYSPGRRIVLKGEGRVVVAIDTIEFEPIEDGTKVTYTADLGLRGFARVLQPFMKGRFAAIGKSAGDGLRGWLAQLEKS